MAVLHAALGFRLHTGWAALVAVAGQPKKLEVVYRRRVELLPSDGSVPRFVYHEAAKLSPPESEARVLQAARASQKATSLALQEILQELRRMHVTVKAAGVPTGSTAVPADLAAILRAHPLIHAAEGLLFQRAVASACEGCGLSVLTARERELWPRVAEVYGLAETRLRKAVDNLRRSVGPPWSADQKTATAAALLALRAKTGRP